MVRAAVLLTEPSVAVMVTFQVVKNEVVEMLKVPVDAPAAMVMLAGTLDTRVLFVRRDTFVPAAGAGAVSVMVPVTEVPPFTEEGETETEVRAGGTAALTARLAFLLLPL